MQYQRTRGNEIEGVLDIFIAHNEEEDEGEVVKWDEVLIHGDPEGLRSLAKLLLHIADLNQEAVPDGYLPVGAREHYYLRAGMELSVSSDDVIVGRIDANEGYGRFLCAVYPERG